MRYSFRTDSIGHGRNDDHKITDYRSIAIIADGVGSSSNGGRAAVLACNWMYEILQVIRRRSTSDRKEIRDKMLKGLHMTNDLLLRQSNGSARDDDDISDKCNMLRNYLIQTRQSMKEGADGEAMIREMEYSIDLARDIEDLVSRSRGDRWATTIDACLLQDGKAYIAHLGDSEVYHLSDVFRKVTQDQNAPSYDPASIPEHLRIVAGLQDGLSSCLGIPKISPSIYEVEMQQGDMLFLATDGVKKKIEQGSIEGLCRGGPDYMKGAIRSSIRSESELTDAYIEFHRLKKGSELSRSQADEKLSDDSTYIAIWRDQ